RACFPGSPPRPRRLCGPGGGRALPLRGEPPTGMVPELEAVPAPPVAESEPVTEVVESEPVAAGDAEPEPGSAIAESPVPVMEETPPPPEREPEPEPRAVAAEPVAQTTPDVSSTLVSWPSGGAASRTAPGNGAPAQASSFEEATSVIPAWQQTDPNIDPKRTVSLQAMPPEEVASGSGFSALLTFETGPFAGRIVALPSQMVS